MSKKTIAQVSPGTFGGKRVLVRVDFNVPQNEDLSISDDSRIRAALPTIELLSKSGARVILVSHLGRPKGASEKFSLKPVADRLSKLLGKAVQFLPDCVGEAVEAGVKSLRDGDICLLENVRFHPEEEKNDPGFARQLASLAEVYVNDAFGTAHRAHASTEGVSHYLKPCLAGLLMDKELSALGGALNNPVRPFATVIGGSKVSSKIGVLENLLNKVDILVVGGAMAFSFLKAMGKQTGKSLVEDDRLAFCKELIDKARDKGVKLILPVDVVCAPEIKAGVKGTIHSIDDIPAGEMGLDLGPETLALIKDALTKAKTIVWNGPLGVFEIQGFEKGTYDLIDMLVDFTKNGARTILGGGDSVAAIEAKGVKPEAFSHVSTGGGASLEFLEGLTLPGVACLNETDPVPAGAMRMPPAE
jgi:phosphoglycerate kinase